MNISGLGRQIVPWGAQWYYSVWMYVRRRVLIIYDSASMRNATIWYLLQRLWLISRKVRMEQCHESTRHASEQVMEQVCLQRERRSDHALRVRPISDFRFQISDLHPTPKPRTTWYHALVLYIFTWKCGSKNFSKW